MTRATRRPRARPMAGSRRTEKNSDGRPCGNRRTDCRPRMAAGGCTAFRRSRPARRCCGAGRGCEHRRSGGASGNRHGELALTFGDDATLRTLNRRYRGKDKPTNVLSFGSPEDWNGAAAPTQPCPLGDVILARETVLREARQQGKTPADHADPSGRSWRAASAGLRSCTHADARKMEAIETDILARLGIADPYRLPARRRAKG